MRYNFSLSNQRQNFFYLGIGIQIICWFLTGLNFFSPELQAPKKPQITPHKPVIYPIIKLEILDFLKELSNLDIRIQSADIYPQEMIIKGLSMEALPFLKFLKKIQSFTNIGENELVNWHRRPDGAWYFSLRILFKS